MPLKNIFWNEICNCKKLTNSEMTLKKVFDQVDIKKKQQHNLKRDKKFNCDKILKKSLPNCYRSPNFGLYKLEFSLF